LIGPGWTGTLPAGITPIDLPDVFSVLIIRADKFSNGTDETAAAERFRTHLRAEPLSQYRTDPAGGAAKLLPVAAYAARFKVAADTEIAAAPITFLRQLQAAVAAPTTPPLSPATQALSDRFNRLFKHGQLRPAARAQFAAGAQAAHTLIVGHYLTHHGPTNWVSFTDIADWGTNYLDRAATTQFLQYSNTHSTAAYYHAFTDGTGAQLNGNSPGYVLTFAKNQIPAAQRFWSLTAYTPQAITLIPNTANKYLVASYTPGLQTKPDGSISIDMTTQQPAGVPQANWLPIPPGRFNIVLRVYGPQGSVADNTYIPPAITPLP
jgi:hypothetical protein